MGTKAKEVSTSDKILAEYLQNAATEQGMSVRSLAEKSGISLGRASMLLRGMRAFYVDEINELCDALGLTSWRVLKHVEDAERALNVAPAPAPIPESDDYELAALDPRYDPELEQF